MQALYFIITYLAYAHSANETETSLNATNTEANCSDPNQRLSYDCLDHSLKGGLPLLLLVTAVSGIWIIYLTYFNSRFVGLILSKVINQLYKDAHINIGSFSFSALSGKLMFRNVYYITKDMSVRIDDGYCIFRWWRPYKFSPWRRQTDLDHGHTRLGFVISGFQCHIYNRSSEYDRLKDLFGLKDQGSTSKTAEDDQNTTIDTPGNDKIAWWRSLFPVIKVSVSYGRFICGNCLLPNTLVVAFSKGKFLYKTTEPSNEADIFMHAVEGNLGTARVMMVPSLNYDPAVTPAMCDILPVHNEPPPRKMGEGYVIIQSNNVIVKYYWDEPGVVKLGETVVYETSKKEQLLNEASNVGTVNAPIWEMIIKFGKHTKLNYSPWADRQRELLWKFFYPADYQKMQVTKSLQVGQRREARNFKLSATLSHNADMDILFTRNEEIQALQINMSKGSFVEVDIPMVVDMGGYTTHVSGQLFFMDVATSMHYRNFLKAESFGFNMTSHYPLVWNDKQDWKCDITAEKASLSLLFAHKDFIANLMEDWSIAPPPDLMFFVPYIFDINLKLKEFELLLPANSHNWIDCNSKPKDNAYLALYGKELNIGFHLPFYQFLPPTFTIPFQFDINETQLCVYLPESNAQRNVLMNLANSQCKWESMKDYNHPHNEKVVNRINDKTWGVINSEWVSCWAVPVLNLNIAYTWHPIVVTFDESKNFFKPPKADAKLKHSTKRSSDFSSSTSSEKKDNARGRTKTTVTFDPTSLQADEIRIDLDMKSGSVLTLYGTVLDLFLDVKENYFGFNDVYTEFSSEPHGKVVTDGRSVSIISEINPLMFRPLQVTVSVNLNDVCGILPIYPCPLYSSQPKVYLKCLTFELDKNYLQTRLQLLLSKLEICTDDAFLSSNDKRKIVLNDLQFRGHAMFSGAGLPLGATTIEYAWLTEVLVGAVQGKLSFPQVQGVIEWVQLFKFLLSNEAHQLKLAFPYRTMPTGINWNYTKKDGSCVDESDVKYLMIRLQVLSTHLRFIQDDSVLDLQVSPVNVCNGNVQDKGIKEAVSVTAEEVKIKHRTLKHATSDEWMETGEVRLGPLITQVAVATDDVKMSGLQDEFLRFHDRKTRRLDFLWDHADTVDGPSSVSSGMASILESVKVMKSWGCTFFTPITSRHPTFYYDVEKRKTPHHRHTRLLKSEPSSETPCDVTDNDYDAVDGNEEVFDTRMDYGMSLLDDGKKILWRPTSLTSPTIPKVKDATVAAGTLLMTGGDVLMMSSVPHSEVEFDMKKNTVFRANSVPTETDSVKSGPSKRLDGASRAISTESNLYRSAESEFRSTSSLSSERFYSAESDVEMDETIVDAPRSLSDSALDQVAARPDVLAFQRKPPVVRKLNLNDISVDVEPTNEMEEKNYNNSDKKLLENVELLSCYSNVLAVSRYNNDSDWLPEFVEVSDGIHPSVIVNKEGLDSRLAQRSSMDLLNRSDSENLSNVIVHAKGAIDVQLTPFLLESLEVIVQAATKAVTTEHPLSILSHVHMSCTESALAGHHLKASIKSEDKHPPHQDNSGEPGTRIEIFMDSVRVNLVQATLGDDPVFNLRMNKMMPTPSITVAAMRMNQVDLKYEMNSKHQQHPAAKDGEESSALNNTCELNGQASLHSFACQLRTLSHNGLAPERSHITSLPDESCRAPFCFNKHTLLPTVKLAIDSGSGYNKRPPKPWGWVMIEMGIKRVSADFTKYNRQVLKQIPPKKHLCDGQLTIDLVWFNVVSPLSASQLSRASRAYRSWNLLTTITPSCCAWMSPADRLSVALDNYNLSIRKRLFSSISAALLMTWENASEKGKSAWELSKHKYDVITEASRTIRSDPNCILCDAMQRHFLTPDNVTSLESAIADNRDIPARTTLETGIKLLISQWLDVVLKSEATKDKSRKRKFFGGDTPPATQSSQAEDIKFGGNLDLSTLLHLNETPNSRSSNDLLVHYDAVGEEEETLLSSPAKLNPHEDIVYAQQQSMYSWMLNQAQNNDVEAQVDSGKELADVIVDPAISKKEKLDLPLLKSQKTYASFLHALGMIHPNNPNGNFIQSFCAGSVSLTANLRNIRMDKQESDAIYSRPGSKKRKREENASIRRRRFASSHSRSAGSDVPIIMCQGLIFETSVIDSVVEEPASTTEESIKDKMHNVNSSNNKVKKKSKITKTRSKLSITASCTLETVKQRVDIAIIRLIHQFIQCSDSIQQAKIDIQVNKYTAGSVSPDTETRHRRGLSKISSGSFGSSPGHSVSKQLRRRHTSPTGPRPPDSVSMISTSTTSETLNHCWQVLYQIVDASGIDSVRSIQDDLRYESEIRRAGGSIITRHSSFHQPYVSMVMSASFHLVKLQLLAEVGDLKASGDLCNLTAKASHTRKSLNQYSHQATSLLDAGLEKIQADVTEYLSGMNKTILRSNVSSCKLRACTNHQRNSEDGNSCSLMIGRIMINLPQHPGSLHEVVTRGSRQLSSHFLEFAQTPSFKQPSDVVDGNLPSMISSVPTVVPPMTPMTPSAITALIDLSQDSSDVTNLPVVVCLSVTADGIEVGANLLPSLKAKYCTGSISGSGTTGCDAEFTVTMSTHTLEFTSEVSSINDPGPYSTAIELPPINAEGELKQHKILDDVNEGELQMKEGEYLSISIKVGGFEHTLTTDLLNQLIFLQEVFMNEVNDVMQKMSRSQKPVPVLSETSVQSSETHSLNSMLYQLQFQLDGIQVTATTPSSNAVQLKTGRMTFELSNRVVRANKLKPIPKYLKLFGKAQVDMTLALGKLVINNLYPEAEVEFQQMAYFTTRIGFQNTSQQAKAKTGFNAKPMEDNSVILISLTRPIFFVQPTAFDKAILFYLAYKNAYDDWTERKTKLEVDVRVATSQVLNTIQSRHSTISASVTGSSLFVQLSVHKLGVCLPVSHDVRSHDLSAQNELSSALVLTIDNTLISACYARSLVTTGHFKGFCVRFADDFLTTSDDWSPPKDVINSFIVPHGTYQICTDTTSHQAPYGVTARTCVNVIWQMKGMDVKLDTKMGMYLSHLVDTLTLITGQDIGRDSSASDKLNLGSETESLTEFEETPDDTVDGPMTSSPVETMTAPVATPSREMSYKEKSKKIEQELNEQIRVIKDLRALGAKPSLVEEEERRMHTLEGALSSIFRQTVKSKLRRTSVKTNTKDSLSRPSHQRSISTGMGASMARNLPSSRLTKSAFSTLPLRINRHPLHEDSNLNRSDNLSLSGSDVLTSRYENVQGFQENMAEVSSSDYDSDVVDGVSPPSEVDKTEQNTTQERSSFIQNNTQSQTMSLEAELELILDIRVGIDGGKIVCIPLKEQDYNAQPSGTYLPSYRTALGGNKLLESNDTTFYVPGVDIKLRYNSELGQGRTGDFFTPSASPSNASKVPLIQVETPGGHRNARKRSCLNAWFSLQSLPETIISPCFLDFLEQALHAVPVTPASSNVNSQPQEQGAVDAFNSTLESLPVDVVVYVSVQPSQVLFNCQPMSRVECLLHIPSLDVIFSSIRDSPAVTSHFVFPDKGMNSSGNLRKLSVHSSTDSTSSNSAFPSGLGFTVVMSDFSIYVFHPYGAAVEQKAGSGRNDSLSVDLEVVKINLVRARKGAVSMKASLKPKENSTVTNISTLVDIGKASFKYDMRRLSEILAFPRAWFRRSIARRLFFGDTTEERAHTENRKYQSRNQSRKKSQPTKVEPEKSTEQENWHGVVLFGLNMSRLDVQMNMSSVMGSTVWSCDGLCSQGRLVLQSSGDKDIFLSCGLENSQLFAKDGIIGGKIELCKLKANCHLIDPVEFEPKHTISVKMNSLDGRIEYMGGCIMMGKLTMLAVKLSDEWASPKSVDRTSANIEKSSVFVPGDACWENFTLAISRSTTPDVIKMLAKLEEFFTQQFQNSVRALSSWRQSASREAPLKRQSTTNPQQEVYAHHRHWPAVYAAIRAVGAIPNYYLGGSLCLHGNQLTVVCFQGNNFRSRTWVLFNILEPNIMFSTEVQEIKESLKGDVSSTLAIQCLTFNLGHGYLLKTGEASTDHMTTVSRVTRTRQESPPSSGASIEDWFAYLTASHNQELSILRTLNDLRPSDLGVNRFPGGGSAHTSSTSPYSHETEIIFALPKLQLDFKTEHMQGPHEPDPNDKENRPVVECSFVTEFTDHICVTMDVLLIMCLHDLISSYLKEKQLAFASRSRMSTVGIDNMAIDPIDIRNFVCNTWQLEPTVRLISLAGRRIEPVGVDYILQKLGFRHARTTIPKWFQRGVLDVLDQGLALIVQNLVVTMTQQKK